MNKFNLIITIICTFLCVELAVNAQPRGMIIEDDEPEEEVVPTPVENVQPEPIRPSNPTPAVTVPTESVTPANTTPYVETGTGSPNTPTPASATTPTTTTTPSSSSGVSYGNTLNRNNEGTGGASNDIEAPTPLEDKKFIKESLVQDGVYEKMRLKERQVLAYDDIREADVLWSKRVWRVIDTREKMNLTFSYPEQPFVGILLDIISKSDEAKIFTDDGFTMETTADEILNRLGASETIEVYNPVTEEFETETVSNDFNPELIKKIRIKEDWVFDEEASTMVVRILAIAPIIDEYDDNDNFRGERAMFWAYYPSIRQDLARYEAYNPLNDAQRLTWEDLLEMRYFSSHIYKEGNVRDMRIKDYTSGVDILLESERIKRKIFEYEHDLWSY